MKMKHVICMVGIAALMGLCGCGKSEEADVQKPAAETVAGTEKEWDVNNMEVLAELSEPAITMYGMGGESARGVVIDLQGKQTYFDWEYTSPRMAAPELYWKEKEKQLQVTLSNASGTGVDVQELHVLQSTEDGELVDAAFGMEDYTLLLEERLSFTYDASSQQLTLLDTANEAAVAQGDLSFLGKSDEGVERVVAGDVVRFELGDSIWMVVSPGYLMEGWTAPQYDGMPDLTIEVEISREGEKLSFSLGVMEEKMEYEGDASSYYFNAYAEVLDKYREALTEKWGGEKLLSEGMSLLCLDFYEGNPLQQVGFSFLDLNGDGEWELLIGATDGEDLLKNVVFDAYARVDGEIVQIFCGQERDCYYLCEDEAAGYEIANVASSGALQSAWHFYRVDGTDMNVVQAIVYDAETDSENPWFMAYDDDLDVSNDTPIDEKLAKDIIESYEIHYVLPDYFSFELY